MTYDHDLILFDAFSSCSKAMSRSTILNPPKTQKTSLPVLVVEAFNELNSCGTSWTSCGKKIHWTFAYRQLRSHSRQKVRNKYLKITTKCCPSRQTRARISLIKTERRWMSFWCALLYILRFTANNALALSPNYAESSPANSVSRTHLEKCSHRFAQI